MFCPKCGAVVTDGYKFCSSCGSTIPEVSQAQSQPTATPQYQPTPAYLQPQEKPQRAPIAKAIVSIALGGEAAVCAFIFLLYSFILFVAGVSSEMGELGAVGFVFFFYMCILCLPTGIIALIFGRNYLNGGYSRLSGLAKAGKIFGIISIAATGLTLLMSIASLAF